MDSSDFLAAERCATFEKMKKHRILIIASILLGSCVVQNAKYFSTVQQSQDDNYGYTPNDPVEIKNGPIESSINSSYYFLSRLRTDNGDSLKLVGRSSVINPNYKSVGLYNRYTGQPIFGGGILDKYLLTPASNSTDTIIIFINPYKKGELMIPKGLQFEGK